MKKNSKRVFAIIMIVVLSVVMIPAGILNASAADVSAKSVKSAVSMKAKKVKLYEDSSTVVREETIYYNKNGDIPYFELASGRTVIEKKLQLYNPSGLKVESGIKGNKVTWTRKNGGVSFRVVFDYKKNTITFDDLNAFFRLEGLSLVGAESGMSSYMNLYQPGDNNYNRYGTTYVINLNKYGIKLLKDKKKFYIPVQTFSDIFASKLSLLYLFNGESLIALSGTSAIPEDLREIYKKSSSGGSSREFAAFNYGELCLALDYLYGLKGTHGIKTFDTFFSETGLVGMFNSQNSIDTDTGLYTMINLFFDDHHCNSGAISYGTDPTEFNQRIFFIPKGLFRSRRDEVVAELSAAREKSMPDGVLPYQEVGDTAYITFDEFAVDTTQDHTVLPTDGELPNLASDTIRLVQYAVAKITRAESKVKRVVVDLSNNGGGLTYAGIYLLAAFLGSSKMAAIDAVTGAQSIIDYKADINLDGDFDEKDTLAGRGLKLHCITSEVSFGCANTVAAVFKDSGKVTLAGRVSGGGACSPVNVSTASGSTFSLSGPCRFSFFKNGGFYDVDRGVEPNYCVEDMGRVYDRAYMNSFFDKRSE